GARPSARGNGHRADRRVRVAAHRRRDRPSAPGPRGARAFDRWPGHQQLGDAPGARAVIEQIAASRCPRCAAVVAPPAPYCPRHPIAMTPVALPGIGEVVTFTTLHSPPEGFRSPLHIALVELEEGARFVCHGSETRGLRVGATVAIEA